MAWMIPAAVGGGAALNYIAAGNASDKQQEAAQKGADELRRESTQARSDLAPFRSAGTAALTRLRAMLGLEDPEASGSAVSYGGQSYDSINALRSVLEADYARQSGLDPKQPEVQASIQSVLDKALPVSGNSGDLGTSPLLRKFTQDDINADPVYQNGLKFGLDEGTKALERRASAAGGYDSGGTLKALVRFGNDYGSTKAGESYGRFTSDQDRTYGKLSGVAGMGSGATTVGVNAGANTAGNLANLFTGAGNAAGASTIAQGNAISSGVNGYMNYDLLRQLSGGGQRGATTPKLQQLGPESFMG